MTLIALWEASDRICSKRLKPLIPALLPALMRHDPGSISEVVVAQLLKISAATIDRLLADVRIIAQGGRRRRGGMSSAVRRSVPIRTFGDWNDPPPGFLEVDFVSHSGVSCAGNYVQTLVLTDIATGWTECVPVLTRDSAHVIQALEHARLLFPFPIKGVDFDNDTAFMNDTVVSWCRVRDLEITRSRAYRKNDQAWVEQKNGAIVRRHVGYGRLEGMLVVECLNRLYSAVRLFGNLFQPSFKLKHKTRVGAKIYKRYHQPEPPIARVVAHPQTSPIVVEKLRALLAGSDPISILAELRAAQADLGKRVGRGGKALFREPIMRANTAAFVTALPALWTKGESRPTMRLSTRPKRTYRTRADPFAGSWHLFEGWLADQPGLGSSELLHRIQAAEPGRHGDGKIRTIQRWLKIWRANKLADLAQEIAKVA